MQEIPMENSYHYFKKMVLREIRYKVEGRVALQTIIKNYGLKLDGLTIITGDTNISPTIYLNYYYDKFLQSGLDAVVKEILEVYKQNKPKESLDLSFFTDFEKVKRRIKVKLVNYARNSELLQKVPHITYLDMAMIFYAEVVNMPETGELATIQIYHHHMSFWNIDVNDLYQLAIENSKNDYQFKSILSVVEDIMEDDSVAEYLESQGMGMYILTNHAQLHGASAILHFEVLEQFRKEHNADNIAILPSSIHEVLLIPNVSIDDLVGFKAMVKEVNKTTLQPDEFLSNSVYVYDGDRITIWN